MYTIITRNECKYCDKVKDMLDLDNIKYVTVNIESPFNKWVLTMMKSSGLKTVPQVFSTNGSLIGGFRELEESMNFCSKKEY